MGRARSFDHDEAARLRASGVPVTEIAAKFGVSTKSVYIATGAATRARAAAYSARRLRALREPCLGGCGRLVWTHTKQHSGLCTACSGAARTTSVRAAELLCSRCREWKPDRSFPRSVTAAKSRRGRHAECACCQTESRRERRHANRERERTYQREYKRRRRAAA